MSGRDPDFAALAHDLSQLLWAIQGRARILGASATGDVAAGLARIAADAAAAAAMLADRDREPAAVAPVIDAAWRQACDRTAATADAEPGRWRLETEHASATVAVPAHVLRRVLANLFVNALEAMPAGGGVTCRGDAGAGRLVLTVSDEGPGVPATIADRLFAMGATADKASGQGLGLAGARSLVARYGGTLEHVPTASGASFRLDLPLLRSAPRVSPESAPASAPAPAPAPARVLVVDDEAAVRAIAGEMLELDGHDVRLATDRDGALAGFTPGTCGAALIDLGLPGASGVDLARSLRSADPPLAIAMLTGWGRERELAQLDPELIDFTGVKPLDQPFLRDLVSRAVSLTARRRAADPEA